MGVEIGANSTELPTSKCKSKSWSKKTRTKSMMTKKNLLTTTE